MEVYLEMVQEFCGAAAVIEPQQELTPTPLPPRRRNQHLQQQVLIDDPECCDDPMIRHGPRGENAYCMNCGLCVENRFLELDYIRMKTSVFFTKKRFYAPVTHFKEHLRRYMGARFTGIPEHIVEGTKCVNVENPDAYFEMKKRLKELKYPKLYKEIFTLIYMHGGHRPMIGNDMYQKCVYDFNIIMKKFLGIRGDYKRHSMPCNYMLLDMLLKTNGHDTYYRFPHLKNDKCRERVLEIYSDLKSKVEDGYQ